MNHHSNCLCAPCSELRRARWRRGEPEVDLTASQSFSVKAILLVVAVAVVYGAIWAAGRIFR